MDAASRGRKPGAMAGLRSTVMEGGLICQMERRKDWRLCGRREIFSLKVGGDFFSMEGRWGCKIRAC